MMAKESFYYASSSLKAADEERRGRGTLRRETVLERSDVPPPPQVAQPHAPREPGVLEVVAYKDGKEIGRATRKTAGEVARLTLVPEKDVFEGDDDLVYVNIDAVDAEGTLCPNAMTRFTARVEGDAEIVGIGNGNPIDYDSFADATHSLFYGKATLVLRNVKPGAKARLTVVADGLPEASVTIGAK